MRWRILSRIKSKKKADRQEEIIKALLKNRGLKTKKQQQEFLKPKDPYKLSSKDVGISSVQIKKAITRIKKAIKDKEKIIVYGDYDADGVCGTAIMWETLEKLGAKAMPFVPKREEGYGLKIERIEEMAEEGVKLIITVDQGITRSKEVAQAQKIGVDVIITDHHPLERSKPQAKAVIYTLKLSGSGVAWFLAKELGGKPGLDLVTIGTITDVMPLIGPNRSLVKFGLKDLRKTKRLGLLALYDFAGISKEKIGTYETGFIIGPRINAAGRMDDPMESLRLVCTRDENRAISLTQEIDQRNRERQKLTRQMTLHARKLWLKEDGKSVLIFIHHDSYQEGIVGLVASKLTEEFYRPAIIVSRGEEWSRASARSIEEFNIVEAIRACADILGAHGGHPRAAGFSVETAKLEPLRKRLIALAEEQLDEEKLTPTLKIEAEIELEDINFELYKKIGKFAPFGMDNRQPVFATRRVKVVEAKTVGNGGQHLSLKFQIPNSKFQIRGIAFSMGNLYSQLSSEKPVDLAYNLISDEWNGEKRLQLRIKDLRI